MVATRFPCTALTSPGQSFVLALCIKELIGELEISHVGISTLHAGYTLTAAPFFHLPGSWADRIGGRQYLGAFLLLMAGATVLLASVQDRPG